MDTTELRGKTGTELQGLLRELRGKLQNLSFELAQGKVKNVREVRKTKRDIAQILTVLHQKDHGKPKA